MTDIPLNGRPILERFSLTGRVSLVTGAGQGIGRAYAHALGEAGASVAVVDISVEKAERVARELEEKGVQSLAVQADVSQKESIQQMVTSVTERWGSLTIAVNNAGIGAWQAAEEVGENDWDRMMDLNLRGVFLCAQAEAAVMLPAGYGKIINTASMSGHIINKPQKQVVYNTSKAGVLHITRSLAAEWAPRGVRVNSISPGYTRTQLVDDLLKTPVGQSMLPDWLSLTPMGRMGEVTDLQGAVVFLASEASDFMTGSDIIIDGGYCAW